MKLVQKYLVNNRCYTNAIKIEVKGIMVHSTGVSQSDVTSFLTNWNRQDVSKCVHAFVTKDNVIQTLPWGYKGWHAGGSANASYIGFEILEPSGFSYDGGANMVGYDVEKNTPYFNEVYNSAVELCAMLCEKYKLDPIKNIICHSEGAKLGVASSHADVMHWFPKHGKDMDQFRKDVKAQIEKQNQNENPKEDPKEEPNTDSFNEGIRYRVQIGAFSNKAYAMVQQILAKAVGLETVIVKVNEKNVVQAGVFVSKENALRQQKTALNKGFPAAVVRVQKRTESSNTTSKKN